MNANVKCFILCIYKTILKPSKQFLTVSNHKVFSLHALWMTILRPSRQLLTVSNHQVFRFYTLLKLSKVFHPSICSSFVLNLRWLLLRVSRWITNMLVLSKYILTVFCHWQGINQFLRNLPWCNWFLTWFPSFFLPDIRFYIVRRCTLLQYWGERIILRHP